MTRSTHNPSTLAGNPSFAFMINGDILRRALIVALVIGSVLTLVNQSAAVFGDEELEYLPLALVFMTPFVVVAISQMLGVRRALMDVRQNGGRHMGDETVLATVLAHGIPLRAFIVGMLAGSINALFVITSAVLEGASVNNLPFALLAQAYALPVLFGLLSQTIAYRRAAQAFRLRRTAFRPEMAALVRSE